MNGYLTKIEKPKFHRYYLHPGSKQIELYLIPLERQHTYSATAHGYSKGENLERENHEESDLRFFFLFFREIRPFCATLAPHATSSRCSFGSAGVRIKAAPQIQKSVNLLEKATHTRPRSGFPKVA